MFVCMVVMSVVCCVVLRFLSLSYSFLILFFFFSLGIFCFFKINFEVNNFFHFSIFSSQL